MGYMRLLLISLLLSFCGIVLASSGSKSHGFKTVFTERDKAELAALEEPLDQKAVKRGHKIYKAHCLKCHGASAKGDGPSAPKNRKPINLVEVVRKTPNFKFFLNFSVFNDTMPGWAERKFTDSDLRDLTHYLRSLK